MQKTSSNLRFKRVLTSKLGVDGIHRPHNDARRQESKFADKQYAISVLENVYKSLIRRMNRGCSPVQLKRTKAIAFVPFFRPLKVFVLSKVSGLPRAMRQLRVLLHFALAFFQGRFGGFCIAIDCFLGGCDLLVDVLLSEFCLFIN